MSSFQESCVPSKEASKMVLCLQRSLRNDTIEPDTRRNMEVDPLNKESELKFERHKREDDQAMKPFVSQNGAPELESGQVCQALELDGDVEVVCQSFSQMKRVINNGTEMVKV